MCSTAPTAVWGKFDATSSGQTQRILGSLGQKSLLSLFSQASALQCVTSSGAGLGQSGDGSADDETTSGDGVPW